MMDGWGDDDSYGSDDYGDDGSYDEPEESDDANDDYGDAQDESTDDYAEDADAQNGEQLDEQNADEYGDANADSVNDEASDDADAVSDDDNAAGDAGDADNNSGIEPPDVNADAFGSRDEYPNATDEDFEDDAGDWTPQDYEQTAANLFGDNPFFGDTAEQRYLDEGLTPAPENDIYRQAIDQRIAPGLADTVNFYRDDSNQIVPRGFTTLATLLLMQRLFPSLDLSGLQVSLPPSYVPQSDEPPQPLPPAFASVPIQDKVDLRKFCSPVGNQKQTSRCSAFAWTHALEMSGAILSKTPTPRLSPNYTMLNFQRMQGDAEDFAYAHSGGEGTVGGTPPGKVLIERGSCRQELWRDDDEEPRAPEQELEQDAAQFKLQADVQVIALDDVKRVLSAGCPVHVAINTGEQFAEVGRDGLFNAAEAPSGRHGRHAMLLVGYVSNFYIIKNSWGDDWGDKGYCYIPKKVLEESEPEFVAILFKRPKEVDTTGTNINAEQTLCTNCGRVTKRGNFCANCGAPLPRNCPRCGKQNPPGARFCGFCGNQL